jgi:phosphate/sulfate permease
LSIDLGSLPLFQLGCLVVAVTMLVWDSIEVGRNDAANLVNAVFGAGILRHSVAIVVAGAAVVFGATLSSDVIDTARKGIFSPTALGSIDAALTIYTSVYIVDTILLYGYSGYGMPVSTTACLVFELLGASFAMSPAAVQWPKAGVVVLAIVVSILMSGVMSFMIQRAVRGAIRDRTRGLATLLLHGGWVGGGMLAGLTYFMLLKGMKNVQWVKDLKEAYLETLGTTVFFILLWAFFAIMIHFTLVIFRKRAARLLFPVLGVLGMLALAFAFGQNDLANCASPGLAAVHLVDKMDLEQATRASIPRWMLFFCGLLLFAGMTTKRSKRVTQAAVATGSVGDHVELWAPRWCVRMAQTLLRHGRRGKALAPRPGPDREEHGVHFDTLRAAVIMSTSASVIATASSFGLPVSTTYVTFAAVVATGMADRIFQRGDAALKLGRAIWVVTSWFLAAGIAAVAAGGVALVIRHVGVIGIAACLAANFSLRVVLKKRSDLQAQRVREEAYERLHPEEFALEDETV